MWEDASDCLRAYRSICTALNLDRITADEAWKNYENMKKAMTLEGDQRPWFGCAIYVASRNARPATVGRPSVVIEGNLINVSGLLRHCSLSVLDFLKKCKKWMEWTEASNKLVARLDYIERKFIVSMVLFRKFKPVFLDLFKELEPTALEQKNKRSGGKNKSVQCSSTKLFEFCWTLFLCVKSRVPPVAEELVHSFHLLLATCDLIYANALIAERRDLLNPSFPGLPEDFFATNYSPDESPPCIVDELCKRHNAISLDATFAKTYCLRPQIAALMRSGTLQGVGRSPETILLPQHFERNMHALNEVYTEYVMSAGDFDERIFLGEDVNDDVGTRLRGPDVRDEQPYRRDTASSLRVPGTPLSGRELLKDKESPSKAQPPLEAVTSSVRLLLNLIKGRPLAKPSDDLLEEFINCSPMLAKEIADIVDGCGEKFVAASMIGQTPNHESTAFFTRRREFATTLYYRILENILNKEQAQDLKTVLEREIIHKSIFACCLEIVMFCYNANRPFPWVLDALEIEPYYFYGVIEIILRTEEPFSRGIIKHLAMIEEKVLESLAWRESSPLWKAIKDTGLPVPKCDEVLFSNQLLNEEEMTTVSPISSHPQLSDRYSSPVTKKNRPGNNVITINAGGVGETQAEGPNGRGKKPARGGSLAIFFRKFFFLANLRMQDLCSRLEIVDVSLKRKIWTCFEHSIVNMTDLMQDRHLDQILMSALYVMCRVLHTQEVPTLTQYTDILRVYRNQPQAESSVYRNVLQEKIRDENGAVKEVRVNLIHFYNNVYVKKIQNHATTYYTATHDSTNPKDLTLSPLPRTRLPLVSPSRKLASRVFINAMDGYPNGAAFDDIPGNSISVHHSPAKDYEAINEQICRSFSRPVKRIFGDSGEMLPAAKKSSYTILQKLSGVMKDRSKQ